MIATHNMNWRQPGYKAVLRLCLSCFMALVLLGAAPASAASLFSTPRWDIPFLGLMNGPAGFKAVDIADWASELDALAKKNGHEPSSPAFPAYSEDFKVYQLQVNDGTAYHVALALAFYDRKGLTAEFTPYFNPDLTNNQQKLLAATNQQLKAGIQVAETMFAQETKGTLKLQFPDLREIARMKNTKEIVYTISSRVVLDMNGVVIPLYGKGYTLQRSGKTVFLFLATQDSDGKFWDGVSDQLINSLEPRRSLLDGI